jgi:hypothetical protein
MTLRSVASTEFIVAITASAGKIQRNKVQSQLDYNTLSDVA